MPSGVADSIAILFSVLAVSVAVLPVYRLPPALAGALGVSPLCLPALADSTESLCSVLAVTPVSRSLERVSRLAWCSPAPPCAQAQLPFYPPPLACRAVEVGGLDSVMMPLVFRFFFPPARYAVDRLPPALCVFFLAPRCADRTVAIRPPCSSLYTGLPGCGNRSALRGLPWLVCRVSGSLLLSR